MHVSSRALLARCEARLFLLLRTRRQELGLSADDLEQFATSFDGRSLRAGASTPSLTAFVLVCMYWCGCRHPMSLLSRPLHPPTALVRWIAGFTLQQQVAYAGPIIERLSQEEGRIFAFALRLVDRMDKMRADGNQRGIPLLPELLRFAEPSAPP